MMKQKNETRKASSHAGLHMYTNTSKMNDILTTLREIAIIYFH